MTIQEDIPEIPRIPPPTLKALTRLCAGKSEASTRPEIVQAPRLVYIGDEVFAIFTDGATAVLVELDPNDDVPELTSNDAIQHSLNVMLKAFSENCTTHRNVEVADIIHWCTEKIRDCPKCEGKRTCMFPRLNTEAFSREDVNVQNTHAGRINDALMDRRRLQLPLHFLQVEEGAVDVIVVHKTVPAENLFMGVAILGDGWRIYSAGMNLADKDLYETCPRLNL